MSAHAQDLTRRRRIQGREAHETARRRKRRELRRRGDGLGEYQPYPVDPETGAFRAGLRQVLRRS